MDNYKTAVEFYAKNLVDTQFKNKGPEHAAIVSSRIFEYSENYVKIFTGKLNSEVADNPDFIKSLKRFIQNTDKKLYIVVENIPENEHMSNALKLVVESSKNPLLNVKLKVATLDFLESVKKSFKSRSLYHFMIADGKMYRIEIGKDEYKAVCNFNDTEWVKILNKTFDNFFDK